jgi:N-alpha-acetyltransferase 35, NatC auxiliary subunit
MLELMHCGVYQNRIKFQALIMAARHQLHFIRSHPLPISDSSSPSLLAFDPYISRRLRSFTPLRVVTLPDINTTWNALDGLFDGMCDLSILSVTTSIMDWQVTYSYDL